MKKTDKRSSDEDIGRDRQEVRERNGPQRNSNRDTPKRQMHMCSTPAQREEKDKRGYAYILDATMHRGWIISIV